MNNDDYKNLLDQFHLNYLDKLKGFNASIKYMREMATMMELMDIQKGELVLDYGAGLGTMRDFLGVHTEGEIYAFDVHKNYYQGEPTAFRNVLHFHLDTIYFMHSIAHIPDPTSVIRNLADKFMKNDSQIWILTPNENFLDAHEPPEGWKPDTTVIEHFTEDTLQEMIYNAGASSSVIHTEPDAERIIVQAFFNPLTT